MGKSASYTVYFPFQIYQPDWEFKPIYERINSIDLNEKK
jgi:hypothetical protein